MGMVWNLLTSRTCDNISQHLRYDGKADTKHSTLRWSLLCCSQPSLAAKSLFPGLPFIAFTLHITLVSDDVGHLCEQYSLDVAYLLGHSTTLCRWGNVLAADTAARSLQDIKPSTAYNWFESSEIWFLICPWSSINQIKSFLIKIQNYSSSFSRDLKFKSLPFFPRPLRPRWNGHFSIAWCWWNSCKLWSVKCIMTLMFHLHTPVTLNACKCYSKLQWWLKPPNLCCNFPNCFFFQICFLQVIFFYPAQPEKPLCRNTKPGRGRGSCSWNRAWGGCRSAGNSSTPPAGATTRNDTVSQSTCWHPAPAQTKVEEDMMGPKM